MNNREVNIDIIGGLVTLAVTLFFWLQINEDLTPFAVYFPEKILPVLGIMGFAILIKGFIRPTRKANFLKEVNADMLFAVITGILWVLSMDTLGFLISSALAMFVLLFRYQPKTERTISGLGKILLLITGELAFMYIVFVKGLHVTLPMGRIFA